MDHGSSDSLDFLDYLLSVPDDGSLHEINKGICLDPNGKDICSDNPNQDENQKYTENIFLSWKDSGQDKETFLSDNMFKGDLNELQQDSELGGKSTQVVNNITLKNGHHIAQDQLSDTASLPEEAPSQNTGETVEIKKLSLKKEEKFTGRIPCLVCGGVSSGCHFGVITCESCKVFFRRSLSKPPNYVCNRKNDCVVRPGRHSSCSACRLQKCISLGMAKENVKKGRYTTERKNNYQTIIKSIENETKKEIEEKEKKKMLDEKNMEETIARLRYVHLRHLEQSEEVIAKIQKFAAKKVNQKKVMESVMGPLPRTSPSEIHEFYKTTGLDLSGFKDFLKNEMKCWERGIFQIIGYARDLQEFMELSLQDRIILLKGSMHDCVMVAGMHNMDAENGMIICPRCEGCLSEDEFQFFGDVFELKSSLRPVEVLKKQNLSMEELAVLRAFVIFDSSHFFETEPENQERIDDTQTHLLNCLLHVLEVNRGREEATMVYANIIRVLTENRTQHFIAHKHRLKVVEVMTDMKCSRFLAEVYSLPEYCIEDLGNEFSSMNIG